MTYTDVITLHERDRVATLTLDRPPLNILDIATMKAMTEHLASLHNRLDLVALLIRAKGNVFSAGVDIPEHRREMIDEMLTVMFDLFRTLNALPMPTVCAVQGDALGGGMELAATCDCLLAADTARFGLPEIALGVFPPVAVARLHHSIGGHRANDLILTGRLIGADEAQAMGLVARVLVAGEFDDRINEYVERFQRLSAYSLQQTKLAMRHVAHAEFDSSVARAIAFYRERLLAGRDPHEGIEAFIAKRPPNWTDS